MTLEWVAKYYSQNMTFVLFSWINSGMQVPPADMVEMYNYLVRHSIMDLSAEN